jgi:hypothetical protein
MKQLFLNRLRCVACAVPLALQIGSAAIVNSAEAPATDPRDYRLKVSTNSTDALECRKRLHLIRQAITKFEADNKRLPHWLSDLSGEYLDEKLLVCPYVKRIGDLQSWRYGIRGDVFEDPKKTTSYAYEFCDKELTLWTGVTKTWQDYKRRQMDLPGVGDNVPIVRCFAHDPILNLPYRGEVFTSGQDWEDRYPHLSHKDTQPESLFYHLLPQTSSTAFPRRLAGVSPRLLDLTAHYNAYLDKAWLPFEPRNDLRELPQGLREFGGVEFDVRGLIQLKGANLIAPYPIVVTGIKVGRSCAKMHFLHGTYHYPDAKVKDDPDAKVKDGMKAASYVVSYRSGAQAEVPILYGRDVKRLWYDPIVPDADKTEAIWTGNNRAAADKNLKIRLFLTLWNNPWKEQPIESLSLVSAMGETAPFVVAITVE